MKPAALLSLVIASGMIVGLTRLQAGPRALVDTTQSPHALMYMPDLGDVRFNGGLLGERFEVARTTMVPHLWEILRDAKASHAWENYLIAAGETQGKFAGPPFNDGDFLKWFEALAQIYAITRDPAIDDQMDRIIAVIAKAQRADGYLHTQTIIPQRQKDGSVREFADREHFETYNMGHLMTAACVHYRATGKTTLLELARKAGDYLDHLAQSAPAALARNAICPSHYMGVIELYRATREPRYLALGQRLIEIRGLVPAREGSDHNQDRQPFRQMTEAVGHAVRANYLFAGVADVYAENGDATLLSTLGRLSDNVAGRKLYLTGMTGALYDGASPDGVDYTRHSQIRTVHQAYGRDYQLPNLTAYNETCATIGYGLWMWRMLVLTGDAFYADRFEQALYNGVLPGISLEGRDYFYVNPLRKLHEFKVPLRWSRNREPNIPVSFCCPPNVVRTIAELPNYVYSLSSDAVWVHLYAASQLDSAWLDGRRVRLRQDTDYPWSGHIKLTVDAAPGRAFTLKLRIPGWLRPGDATLQVNGQPLPQSLMPGSYVSVERPWQAGDVLELTLPCQPALWEANPLVEETAGQVALQCGPLVYCVESNDLPPGVKLADVVVPASTPARFTPARSSIADASVVTFTFDALVLSRGAWKDGQLYRQVSDRTPRSIQLTAVPYYAWGNRGDTEMTIWLPAR